MLFIILIIMSVFIMFIFIFMNLNLTVVYVWYVLRCVWYVFGLCQKTCERSHVQESRGTDAWVGDA